ncbi:glyoxalase superfamily protein [Streptomyces sp. SID3343]|uniref:glyoxalase superfamily protein n=1 Tax=Streptomyces sp. SID3343 TaxID=2690260 RepID=UPI00136C7188|nr:glyoxalase superfamily protein [Streptomyces sp. SID3343]MYW05215.1 VOC family protein [Streptomyces sp. SID3343]
MNEQAIPILRVSDATESVTWYARLGFTKQWEHRFEPDLPAFVEIARGEVRLFLSEHTGDAGPNTLIYLRIHNIDEVAKEFTTPVEQAPWAKEVHLTDPDGNRLRLGTPTD